MPRAHVPLVEPGPALRLLRRPFLLTPLLRLQVRADELPALREEAQFLS